MAETPTSPGDFYVGYEPRAPAGIARFVRAAVVAVLLVSALVAVLLASAQKPLGDGVFEFGVVHRYEGVIHERPQPALEVLSGDHPSVATGERHYLVAPFKHGAGEEVAGLDGRRVRLEGSLVHRDGGRMLELVPGSIEPLEGAGAGGAGVGDTEAGSAGAEATLGRMTLRGEIVDAKCYLGVMKPGSEKPHRSCAVRCISGGIPPLFLVRGADGPAAQLLLVGADGRRLHREVLDFVAEPLEITGEVRRTGDLYVLRADPSSFRRL